MASAFEKNLTLIGTVVSIITFALSVFNWMGASFAIDATIPNKRLGVATLIIYCILTSYGSAKILLALFNKKADILLTWLILNFSYAFGFLFLLDKARLAISSDREIDNKIIACALFCSVFLHLYAYSFPKIYPDGLTFNSWIGNSLNGIKEFTFILWHAIILLILFVLLSG